MRREIDKASKDKGELELEFRRRQFVTTMNSTFHNVLHQYMAGEGFSPRAIADMRRMLDAMERGAAADDILAIVRSGKAETPAPDAVIAAMTEGE